MTGLALPLWELINTTLRFARSEEQPTRPATRVAFGRNTRITFDLDDEDEEGNKKPATLHCYGDESDVPANFTSIQTGQPLPANRRLPFCNFFFKLVDEDASGVLSGKELAIVLHLLGLPMKPKMVIYEFGNKEAAGGEGTIALEEFMIWASSSPDAEKIKVVLPMDFVLEMKELWGVMMSKGKLKSDREASMIRSFVEYVGLDWELSDLQSYMALDAADRNFLHFIDLVATKVRLGTEPGNRTLRVRNWWPGSWFVECESDNRGKETLQLVLESPEDEGGWRYAGEIITAGCFSSQPFVVGFRVSGNSKFNVLISKLHPTLGARYLHRRARELADEAYLKEAEVPGAKPVLREVVMSPTAVVEIVRAFHNHANLTALAREELVQRVVMAVTVVPTKILPRASLTVLLKLLGTHAEPQHITYLLQSQQEGKPSAELVVEDLIESLTKMDISLSVPLDLLRRLRQTWELLDKDGDNALSAVELRHFSNVMRLGWKSKEISLIMRTPKSVPLEKGDKPNDALIDWIQFLDVFVELYGDPFYEKRYRELYELIDCDKSNAIADAELLPLLRGCALDADQAEVALNHLLGNSLSLDRRQFAAGMFEAELTGESFPNALHAFAKAYWNIDANGKGFMDPTDLSIVFQKLGAVFTLSDRDSLVRQLDKDRTGEISFGEFIVRSRMVDKSKIGNLADVFTVKKLCSLSSYEMATSVEELNSARDVSKRPPLERFACEMIERSSKAGALILEKQAIARRRKTGADGDLETDPLLLPIDLDAMKRWGVLTISWMCVARAGFYGLASGGANAVVELITTTYLPFDEANVDVTGWALWVHYIISYGPGVIFSLIEALTMCYDFLASAISIAKVAQVSLYKEPMDALRVFISNAITSEALELGHPNNIRYNINPLKGSNKFMLWLCGVLYALRSGITKFILKIVIRKVLTRSAVRGASAGASLITLPVVAFWNAVLAVGVMKNCRTVVLGRSNLTLCVDTLLALYQELERQTAAGVPLSQAVDLARTRSHSVDKPVESFSATELPRDFGETVMRAFAICVVASNEFHPNLETMIKHLGQRLRLDPGTIHDIDDAIVFEMDCLPKLTRLQRYIVMDFLLLALVVDGAITITQKIMFKKLVIIMGFEGGVAQLVAMGKKFNDLTMTPQDVAFCMFNVRELTTVKPTTLFDLLEAQFAAVLKFLSF